MGQVSGLELRDNTPGCGADVDSIAVWERLSLWESFPVHADLLTWRWANDDVHRREPVGERKGLGLVRLGTVRNPLLCHVI